MDEPLLHQKFERAVDGDRRRPRDALGEFLDDIISAGRARRRQERLQHLPADWRKSLPAFGAHRFRMRERIGCAARMIVARIMKDGICRMGHLPSNLMITSNSRTLYSCGLSN